MMISFFNNIVSDILQLTVYVNSSSSLYAERTQL